MNCVKIIAYYALRLERYDMEPHIHRHYEYMYTLHGECEVTVAGRHFLLRENQFIFLGPGVPHRLFVKVGSPCSLLNLEFEWESKGEVQAFLAEDSDFFKFWLGKPDYLILNDTHKVCFALKDIIAELMRDYCREAQQENGLLALLAARLLIETARCYTGNSLGKTGAVYVNRARTYIEQNFDQGLTVSQVARQAGVNHSYLQSLFSRSLGCGVMSYVNHLRLEKACFLLKNSQKSVTDIAFEVGFNSRQEFGYCFFKRFAQSPRAYRKLLEQNVEIDTGTFR